MTTQALPHLRDDLELVPGPKAQNGVPSWTIYDPLRNRYYRIDQMAFGILRHWGLGDVNKITQAVEQTARLRPQPQDFEWLVQFLRTNMLIKRSSKASVDEIEEIRNASKLSWGKWAVHNYLFFRIPLVRPQSFLQATQRVAFAFMGRTALWVFAVLLMLGGYFLVGQWDGFFTTFLHFTTAEGLVWYGFALIAAKIVHELGHAYTAVRYGCRVPTMGVAFLVMWPVLYTDTSDAWRLTDRKQRLAIGAAGMIAELGLAVVATMLWSFLPDGPMRSAAFITATLTWVMTLGVNLNPFMRFDGYYLLADYLDVENMQNRAFAYAKWWMRERLFAFGEAPPEPFGQRLGNGLIAYAFATWVYRFFLFLGIAVLVYAFFFKILGLILFAVEILWFIVLPITKEIGEWKKRRTALTWNANLVVMVTVIGFGLLALVVPWQTTVSVPVVWEAQDRSLVFAPVPGEVRSVNVERGQSVKAGDVLMVLSAPDLDHNLAQVKRNIALLELQARREAAGLEDAQNIQVIRRRLEQERADRAGLLEQHAKLSVRAHIDGQVRDVIEALRPGLWVDARTPLVQIVGEAASQVTGFVSDADIRAISGGANAMFYAEDPTLSPIALKVRTVSDVNTSQLDLKYLASIHGGEIAVEANTQQQLIPLKGIYRVSLDLANPAPPPSMVLRGTAHIDAVSESLLVRAVRRVWGVLIRESGF
ncbi:HlyD family efflux transporter periplasmic adaptor subunit [Magnetovibrio sp. PR-2]|uniref:HlyD family efflux transporter periplasmic adaptor subunit n=1 Tax=Magnetovibrio sp. PR-2 TaxID=3120356 RepID=UPI002FCE54BB